MDELSSATNPLNWTAKTQYDYTLGAAAGTKGINDVISRVEFDSIGRPFRTTAAYGTSLAVKSEASHPTATSNIATASSQIDATNWTASKVEYDGFDRPFKGWRSEDGKHASEANFTILTQTVFDALSRAKQVSNPYRPSLSETLYYTTSKYDLAGRVTEVETPDGAKVKSAYDGTRTLVEDQAGKKRISKTNALGQLKEVWEITASDSATESVTFPNYSGLYGYKTSYSYDLLNNLTLVDQGEQEREFSYNSLSRLLSATNPESGTIEYEYDSNGNLTKKTDARDIETTFTYDALNRVTEREYTNEPSGSETSDVAYTYGTTAPAIGKLNKIESSVSKTEFTGFDILGRVTSHKQTTDGTAYITGYTYNLSGALIEETYPSGRVVKNVLDNDGDLETVKSKKNSNFGFFDYSKNFTYNAAGAVASMQLGNGRWESTVFNSRLQPTQIALGATPGATDKLKLNYTYNTTGNAENNGNVLTQKIAVVRPGQSDLVFDQTYTYDELNRLKVAEEKTGTTTNWKQTFTFDRYGNRRFDQSNTTFPESFSNPNLTNPTFNASNNKFASGQNWAYDAAGNVIGDPEGRTFAYDAENKQIEVEDSSSATLGTYFFDGDGKRVKKVVPSTGEVTIFVYDAGGKLVAEYSTIVQSTNDAKVQYLTNDNLGTPRINTDANGNMTSRSDYLPYGEEIVSLGGRSSADKYVTDDVRQGFTGYQKDEETGLDFAQARMYAKGIGRFTSVDPVFLTSSRLRKPQGLNLYSYVSNRPLSIIDPSGEDVVVSGDKDSQNRYAKGLSTDETGLKLKMKGGKLDFDGKEAKRNSLTDVGKKIYDAITDTKSTTYIEVGRNGGSVDFESAVSADENGNVAIQPQIFDFADLDKLNDAKIENFNERTVLLHGTLEAISIQKDRQSYETAHAAASKISLGIEAISSKETSPTTYTTQFQVEGGGSQFTVEFKFRNGVPKDKPLSNSVKDILNFRAKNPIDVVKVSK